MPSCLSQIASDILYDCDNLPVGGIETDIVLMNRDDVDFTATTLDGANSKIITNLICKTNKAGFLLEGIKQLNSVLAEFVPNADDVNRWRHNLNFRIYNLTADVRKQIDTMSQGASLMAVVQKKWRGANDAHGFMVLGYGTGLELQEGTENSNENSGAFVGRLASSELALEGESFKVYLDTDYATSQTAFGNKFAGPIV